MNRTAGAFLRIVDNNGARANTLQWQTASSKPRKPTRLYKETMAERAKAIGLAVVAEDETAELRTKRAKSPDYWNIFDYSSQSLDQVNATKITYGHIASIENLARVCARTLTRLWERDSNIVKDFLEDFINNLDQASRDFIRTSIEDFKNPETQAIAMTVKRPEAMGFEDLKESHRYAFFNFIIGILQELELDSNPHSEKVLELLFNSFNDDNSQDLGHSDNVDGPQFMNGVHALAKSLIKFGANSNSFSNFIGWYYFGIIAKAFKKELKNFGIEKAAIEAEKLLLKAQEIPEEKLVLNYPNRQENLQASEAFHQAISYLLEALTRPNRKQARQEQVVAELHQVEVKPTVVA